MASLKADDESDRLSIKQTSSKLIPQFHSPCGTDAGQEIFHNSPAKADARGENVWRIKPSSFFYLCAIAEEGFDSDYVLGFISARQGCAWKRRGYDTIVNHNSFHVSAASRRRRKKDVANMKLLPGTAIGKKL
ncbi:hypothetical protein CEXT_642741 [Caerostris extrusa]|uniref:Uncharacterized protein n=1 Tax=Caerostris extrusa TaxID=172846 RepID=A0AAV4RDY5_CAEEX|nr:hypothetical protein CEXT_642741 [Caerostris extrusa]